MRTLFSVALTMATAGLLFAGCCDKDCDPCSSPDKGPGGDVGPGSDAADAKTGSDARDSGPGSDATDSGPGSDATDSGPGSDARDASAADVVPPPKKVCPHGWCKIKGGTFSMGSPTSEPCREHGVPKETAHQVTLTNDFEMMDTEVSQADFLKVMGFNPSGFSSCGIHCPADTVTWHQAVGYCNKMTTVVKLTPCYTCTGSGATTSCAVAAAYQGAKIYDCPGFRLPTEAEWEYAYRAGTTTAAFSGAVTNCMVEEKSINPYAWYLPNSSTKTHPGGTRKPNPWGLHDMGGNVWEWIHDLYVADLGSAAVTDPYGGASGTVVNIRGGSWGNKPRVIRSANRSQVGKTWADNRIGIRCVRTLIP